MDPRNLPPPKPVNDKEPLVKARVIANYGGKKPGEVVSVTASELKRVPHALVSLEEDARMQAEAAKPKAPALSMFRGLKRSQLAISEAHKFARMQGMKAYLESLGLKVQ